MMRFDFNGDLYTVDELNDEQLLSCYTQHRQLASEVGRIKKAIAEDQSRYPDDHPIQGLLIAMLDAIPASLGASGPEELLEGLKQEMATRDSRQEATT